MGPISKKLARRFTKWSDQFWQEARTVHIPKDVRDVETLVKEDGQDPLHAVYISVHNITSVFAECVSVLPELEPYYDVIAAAEDEYMPDAPPMSPLILATSGSIALPRSMRCRLEALGRA